MFNGWENFFLMAGGAAAVLIGLIFVVISLLQDRSRSQVLAGSKLYMGPIVLGVSFVLALSAAALTPGITRCEFAAITAIIALWGLVRSAISIVGIGRFTKVHWTDIWFYGVYPSVIYLAFGADAFALWMSWWWAQKALAVIITLGLLLAIRNEWDLITWITPRGEHDDNELS
ncbi:MAG TPA: hypothetical protein VHS33_03425 [Sphingomicrobium sp.]|jgi:hypothetical protein|nr:hypothetical protein [Sphingomicrobium sp.]